ncbi:amidohydrolase family protein [Cutibacterium sp. WCA-380-WT-3A]|uniref:Amidohydrolase family protein n=1 Tax=Cutibacterium porci TaxID=2605781 RepID=A0A7K0J701_9ACTN|nr:amidohydrolase family protein [Cutibacterium porci]MSS45712.1 amidohydrolase family protein [Cutibacterium porci]
MILLHDARILDLTDGSISDLTDVLLSDRVLALGPEARHHARHARVRSIDLDGRLLMPGLWDEHVHVEQWALASRKFLISQTASCETVLKEVAAHVSRRARSNEPILQGFGFRPSLWSSNPNASQLDAVTGDRAVVLVSADLHSSWCNTAAMRKLGIGGNGFLREQDSFDIQTQLSQVDRHVLDGWVGSCSGAAARLGITGIRDMEFNTDVSTWLQREADGRCPLRVEVSVYPERLDAALRQGLATGQSPITDKPGPSRVAMGPLKVIVDGSMSTRTAWCTDPYPAGGGPDGAGIDSVRSEDLVNLMRQAKYGNLQCAIHAIGDRAVSEVLDAFEATGATGSIEHAQLLADEDVSRFAALKVRASVQPLHLVDDRDAIDVMWATRANRCFRFADMVNAGIDLALGSDAPVSPVDPWGAIRVAVERTVGKRPSWHPNQALTLSQAIMASTRHVAKVVRGGPGDVIAVAHNPFDLSGDALAALTSDVTVVGGEVTASAL